MTSGHREEPTVTRLRHHIDRVVAAHHHVNTLAAEAVQAHPRYTHITPEPTPPSGAPTTGGS